MVKTNKDILIEYFTNNFTDIMLDMQSLEHGYLDTRANCSVARSTLDILDELEYYCANLAQYNNLLVIGLLHNIGKIKTKEDVHKKKARYFNRYEAVSCFDSIHIVKDIKNNLPEFKDIDIPLILEIIAKHNKLYNFYNKGKFNTDRIQEASNLFKDIEMFDIYSNLYYCKLKSSKIKDITYQISNLNAIRDIVKSRTHKKVKEKEIILLIGLPRAGKSTKSKELHDKGYSIVSHDYFIEKLGTGSTYAEKWESLSDDDFKYINKLLRHRFTMLVQNNKNICVDMTNLGKKSRKKWLSPDWYNKKAIILLTDKDTALSRNTEEKYIPEFVHDGLITRFVWPDYNEFDEIEVQL